MNNYLSKGYSKTIKASKFADLNAMQVSLLQNEEILLVTLLGYCKC